MRWFVVKTRPRKEGLACFQLSRQGLEFYCPLMVASGGAGGRRSTRPSQPRLVPLFPSYVFVRLNADPGRWRAVNGTIGVSRLVQFGETPSPAPAGLVESFIARTDADGRVNFEDPLVAGEAVRLVGGAFDGLIGELQHVSAQGRVAVLMDVMARKVTVTAPRTAVIRAA